MAVSLRSYLCLFILSCVLLITESCKKNAAPATAPVATLKSTAPFPMGSAVVSTSIQNNYYYQGTLLREYNSVTSDYELKFNIIEPEQGVFNYSPGDYIVSFAAQHHIRMHAHNLIWHQALPDWVLNFQGDSLAWENRNASRASQA